ncbi:hypothetical protein FH972_023069 [Carpinus fangiana]|uniref:Uncharacterized protein n=1 Tax=Carpinus fangiana TaxID=176857 RepID=A0A5N6KUI7_9ROSI|nr:hypothetical protein FH972_023069 [Carpinus fangiana]
MDGLSRPYGTSESGCRRSSSHRSIAPESGQSNATSDGKSTGPRFGLKGVMAATTRARGHCHRDIQHSHVPSWLSQRHALLAFAAAVRQVGFRLPCRGLAPMGLRSGRRIAGGGDADRSIITGRQLRCSKESMRL